MTEPLPAALLSVHVVDDSPVFYPEALGRVVRGVLGLTEAP